MTVSINGSGGITYPDGSVNTTRSVSTAGDTMSGSLAINSPSSGSTLTIKSDQSGMLKLIAGNTVNHAYMEIYPRSATPSLRGAYLGFGGAGSTNLEIGNEIGNTIVTGGGYFITPSMPSFYAVGAGYGSQYFGDGVLIGNVVSGTNTGLLNNGGHFSPGSGGGTKRFTAPVAGKYWFSAGCLWYGGSSTATRGVSFVLNGNIYANSYQDSVGPSMSIVNTVIMSLAQGDWVSARVNQQAGTGSGFYDNGAVAGSYGGSPYNWFCGALIG